MYFLDNPVLQRELLVNLRMRRGFVLLFAYVALLGVVVYVAWPAVERLDLTKNPEAAKRLINMFFLGQYVLLSLMTPSFAAGTLSGEKERKTYEMLLASPMRPGAIVLGKLLASLAHLAVFVFCSLPIVMICLPLGGVHYLEVLATYVAMAASILTFGMICLTASAYFSRSVASEVVSYLVILPLALFGILFYRGFETAGWFRLWMLVGIFPGACLAACAAMMSVVSARLLHPPDVGGAANDALDLEEEQREAVGMVIRSDQFPDRFFAPPKRTDFMADGTNPVYDKEMRSELFGHGSLMLRLVIQLSMALAMLGMIVCLYMWPRLAPWYAGYVLLFNMLIGPVFSAGTITSERERQTLELLLTTTLSPWTILSGKLVSSLRIGIVLTCFVVWPLLLAWILPPWGFVTSSLTMLGYLVIILLTCVTTTVLGTFCSVIFRRTSVSLTSAYILLILLFALPVAVKVFADQFAAPPAALVLVEPSGLMPASAVVRVTGPAGRAANVRIDSGDSLAAVADAINAQSQTTGVRAEAQRGVLLIGPEHARSNSGVRVDVIEGQFRAKPPLALSLRHYLFTSPFCASFSLPLHLADIPDGAKAELHWSRSTALQFVLFHVALDAILIWLMIALFNTRWRVASR